MSKDDKKFWADEFAENLLMQINQTTDPKEQEKIISDLICKSMVKMLDDVEDLYDRQQNFIKDQLQRERDEENDKMKYWFVDDDDPAIVARKERIQKLSEQSSTTFSNKRKIVDFLDRFVAFQLPKMFEKK